MVGPTRGEAYFRDVLGLPRGRTAYKRLAIGRMLMGFEEPERGQLRAAIAAVGLAKATVVVPAIERLREWKPWLEWAGQLPTVALLGEGLGCARGAAPRSGAQSPWGAAPAHGAWPRCPTSRPWSSWTGSLRSGPRWWGPAPDRDLPGGLPGVSRRVGGPGDPLGPPRVRKRQCRDRSRRGRLPTWAKSGERGARANRGASGLPTWANDGRRRC